jgi:MFS family permease
MQQKLKSILPHVVAIAIFIALSTVYFHPQLKGYQIKQHDIQQHIGNSNEIANFRAKYGSEPLWTNSVFGGMPAYQISTYHPNYVGTTGNLIFKIINRPIGYIVIAMIGFYILLLCFKVNPWAGIIGAVVFGFSSIYMLYLAGGHNSKVHAIALLAPVIGGVLYAYKKNFWIGGILFAFFLCLELAANHVQMTYYGFFLVAAIVIVELYTHIKEKAVVKFLKASIILLIAGFLAVLPSASNLLTTAEYSKYTTRGKSELTISPNNPLADNQKGNGLDPDYITMYNFGYGEVWSLVIPNVKGGAQNYLGNNKDAMREVKPQFKEAISQHSSYWGEQAGSGGAFYFGAGLFVLFVLGMFFIKSPIKWAFFAAALLGIVLAWKDGFFINFFINHFPLFNKFRDTKMTLILPQIAFSFIGVLFISEMFSGTIIKKKLLYVIIGINGLLILFYIMPNVWFDFLSNQEVQMFDQQYEKYGNNPEAVTYFDQYQEELQNARISIFKKDVLRSLFFTAVISLLVYFFVAGKLKKNYFLLISGLLILTDIWAVDKRYLNNESKGKEYKYWVKMDNFVNPFRASMADKYILNSELASNPKLGDVITKETEKYLNENKGKINDAELEKEKITFRELGFATDYRVLTFESPFQNANPAYFHKTLGGYHGAKLKKYQEIIDFYLSNEINEFSKVKGDSIDYVLQYKIPVLNMLNTKYLIYNPEAAPIINPYAYGNCWIVKNVSFAENADGEITTLGKVDLKTTAVVNQKFKSEIPAFNVDSTAVISLTSYKPNHLVYSSKTSTPQLAVFSEIYYPKGWNAYIDGKPANHFTANYILRAIMVPAGEHTIEFKFEPKSYQLGVKISIASSILLLLLALGAVGFEVRKWLKG